MTPSSSANRTKRASSMPWLSVGPAGNRMRSERVEKRNGPSRRSEPYAGLLQRDLALGVDDAGTKLNGGHVPFADSTQAQDEPARAGSDAALLGRGHQRRVGERRRFDRKLARKV